MAALCRVFWNKWITPPKPVGEGFDQRVIIITGATSGVGEQAAYKFAAQGASKIIITARNLVKGESVRAALMEKLREQCQVEVWPLDMMSYVSVLAFAERAYQLERLDIVILNAGIRRAQFAQSEHGWEEDLQTNTLSTVLLAVLLIPKLRQTGRLGGKIPVLEFVNSGLHQTAAVPAVVQQEASILAYYNASSTFQEARQYKFSKAFLMYAVMHLADQLPSHEVIITSVCPGWVNTNLGRDHFFPGVFVLAFLFIVLFMRTPSQGANTLLSGVTQGEGVHGRFWQHDHIQPLPPSLAGTEMRALRQRVWDELVAALQHDIPSFGHALETALTRSA